MKKTYRTPVSRVYKVNLTEMIAGAGTGPNPEVIDDSNKVISGEEGGNQELGRQTSGSNNIWDNQW